MNWRLIILQFGLIVFGCSTDKAAKETLTEADDSTDKVIERIKTNNDFFTEIVLTADTSIENGTFNKLALKNADRKVFEIHDVDAYDTIESKGIDIKNEVDSHFLLVQKVNDTYYISLFGAQYGCCARQLTILQVDKNGVRKIFKGELQVDKISVDESGEIRYFGIDSFSEALYPIDSLDVLLFTYNPTLAYNLNRGFTFDSVATRQYNEQNYVFAGFKYDGEIKVAFPKDGQERISRARKPYIYKE